MEKHVEETFVAWCDEHGLRTLKTGTDGWPDRLVLGPGGHSHWLEFKTPETEPTPLQEERLTWLWRRQHVATVVRSLKEARVAVRWLLQHP